METCKTVIHKGPERVVELVERVWYRCLNPEHRHAMPHVAVRCIAKAKKPVRVRNSWTQERREWIVSSVEAGRSFAAIGREVGVTGGYIGNLFDDAIRNRADKIAPPRPPGLGAFDHWYHKQYLPVVESERARVIDLQKRAREPS